MNCPKCGFSQPDDIYCAMCGVDIEKYSLRKKKKRRKRGALSVALIAIALVAWGYLGGFENRSSQRAADEEGGRVVAPVSQFDAIGERTDDRATSSSNRFRRSQRDQSVAKLKATSFPSDRRTKRKKLEQKDKALTPPDWFQRGVALDDDSETEIEYYEKALELDPNFAPALFRLGAIYYRQARYEQADEVFSRFLNYATEEEKSLYDIYVYYSLSDVDRLLELLKSEKTDTEPTNGSQGEQQEATEEAEEVTEEATEEINTIVRFSPNNGHVTVPVILNDVLTTTMLVDTGAGITVLSTELAEALQLEFERDRFITLKTMAMDVDAQLARLDTIQVGDAKKKGMFVAVTDIPIVASGNFTAILGMDFLRDYVLQIDNQNQTFTLTSKIPTL